MPEIHLRQPGFTYRVCGPFTKNKEKILKFKETDDFRYIYQKELDKVYFLHDMAYRHFKYLTRGTLLIKYSVIKRLIILKIQDGHQRGLVSMALFLALLLKMKIG